MRVEGQRLRCIQFSVSSTSTHHLPPRPSRASAGPPSQTCFIILLVSYNWTCVYNINLSYVTCTHTCVHMHTHVQNKIGFVYLMLSVCTCTRACMCVHVCVCVCVHACVRVCVYLCDFVPFFFFLFAVQGTGPTGQPASGPTNLDNPTHPILPKRVMYYQASFDRTTTVSQVKNEGKSCYIPTNFL